MKYLDEPRLAYWSNFLRSVELGDRLLSVRTDAFSCEFGDDASNHHTHAFAPLTVCMKTRKSAV